MKKLKKQKGITLVALVITIIILLLLAGISIQAITKTGLFEGASQAKKETQRAQVTEWLNLKLIEEQMHNPTGTAEEIIEATRGASDGNEELAKMGKNVVVDANTSTIEDGEPVDVYFYVQVDEDVYKVEMAGAKFIGEAGKIPPPDLAEGDITFTYTVDGQEINKETWTNKSVTVTASTEITGYTLQTSKDGKKWYDVRNQTFTENGKIYVALYDGKNYGGSATGNVTNIDTTRPIVTGATATTNSIAITATDEASEIVGYAVTESDTEPSASSFTTVESTTSLSTTVTGKTQGTTYYVWVKDAAGNVSESKTTETESVPGLVDADITFTYSPAQGTWTNGYVEVTATANKEITGYTLMMSTNGKQWSEKTTQTVWENGKIYAALYDGINYGGAATGNVTNIDKNSPEIKTFGGNITLAGLNLNIGCSDAESGIDEIEWHYEGGFRQNWNVLEDGNYKFKYDGQKWVSNNKRVNNSTATTTWKVNLSNDDTLSFAYKVSSQKGNDKLTIILDGTTIVNAISGNLGEQTYETQITAGEHTLTAKYTKDGSVSKYDDCAYIIINKFPEVKEIITDKIDDVNSKTISITKTIETEIKPGPYEVYAVIRDKAGNQTINSTIDVLDEIVPTASINLSSTSTDTFNSITAEVAHTDNESGVNIENCKWVYNTTSSAIGTNESSYIGGIFSSGTQTITLNAASGGEYYLHVLTTDKSGNKKETISNAVTVASKTDKLVNAVNIGDYVGYDATNSYSYTSLTGTGPSHGNGYGNQTFTSSSSIKWRVLSKNTSTEEVVLISEESIPTDAGARFYMKGAIGYLYAEQELNEICKIYGYGTGANTSKTFNYVTGDLLEGTTTGTIKGSGARSINVDDVNKICNVTPSKIYDKLYGYSYTMTTYYPTKKTTAGYSTSAASRTELYTYYNYGMSSNTGGPSELYETLFERDTNDSDFWMGSRCVKIFATNTRYYVRYVSTTNWGSTVASEMGMGKESKFWESESGYGVRPLVYLKSSVQTSGKDTSGAWTIFDN